MGHRLRATWLASLLAASCIVATACADESGSNPREEIMERNLEHFDERLEAKRRDSLARCENGDKKSCSEAVCLRLMTEGPSAGRYRDCARSQGFKTTDRWVQFSELRTINNTRLSIQIVCLTDPEVMKLGGEEVKIFRQFKLDANTDRPTGFHDRNRFYTNMLGGPDYATWEAGANELCKPGNHSK